MDVSLCPPLVAWQAGRKQVIERLQLERILKHPLALRDSADLQLNIDVLDSEGKIRARAGGRGEEVVDR